MKGKRSVQKLGIKWQSNSNYTILRQVFDIARDGGDYWVEGRFCKGKKIEQVDLEVTAMQIIK